MNSKIVSTTTILTLFATMAPALPAHAIDKCKVKIDARTGVIAVSATGVSGTLQWGAEAGAEDEAFFNPSCVAGDTAKGCQLADPLTLASKTPPIGCTIYLDDGTAPCSVWIKGCSPGQRDAPQKGSLVWKDANGVTAGASDDNYTQLIRDDGTVLSRISMAGGAAFLQTGSLVFTSADCTGPALIGGDPGTVKTTVVAAAGGPVYYAPDAGTYQAYGSYLSANPVVMSPLECFMYYPPGSFFVAPDRCCTPLASFAPLSTPATVDFTGITFPLSPALQ